MYEIKYFETSALSAEKVNQAFVYLLEKCMESGCYVKGEDSGEN